MTSSYGNYPGNYPGNNNPVQTKSSNGLAIAGMVCGIIGVLVFAIVLGPLAIIFGGVGLSRANKGASGKGMAIAGLVLGIIDVIFGIIAIAALSSHRFGFI